MERLKDVVSKKKEKSANTKPKYGMRKLSVGLVPVFLGAIVLIPGVGYAKEVSVGATSAPRTEIVGEVLSRRDDKKDEEYAIQKVEAVSNQEGIEATSTSRSSANIVEENESINKNSKENDKEIIKVLNEDKFTEENKEEKSESEDTNTQDGEKSAVNEDLQTSEEKTLESQQAGKDGEEAESDQAPTDNKSEKSTEPNYGEDEKKIKDYDGSERYKQTDLQQGNVNQTQYNTDENKVKDGFKFELKNPSAESPSKTEWGYQVTIDKETGQRTYTRITVTDGGRVLAGTGKKPMIKPGDKLVDGSTESPAVNFKPDENGEVTGTRQRNYNYEASKETLKHINSQDNPSTSFGMKDDYTKENPGIKYFGDNFELNYMVNPWPNENDKLEQLKLNGQYNEKVFVQGQEIDTGIKVDNIDENAKERLVGQVYNPITGKIVPGASAYIGDNGNIHIKMPEGAIKKDESGKTVINEDSIFNTPEFKALQNLDVKFFARPRTKAEFENVAKTGENSFGEKIAGTYTETGAGSGTINHKGQDVVIDKQGIDRYDHYNLIGGFKLNLDDTRYYNQNFKDENGDDTSKNTSSNIRPNEPFKVQMFTPKNPSKTDKSAKAMNEADGRGEANGRLIMDFIKKANEGKSEDDKWKIEASPNNISEFSITAPASAKAGDFIAIPVEYTYTNGSKDIHWFHFVVKESDNNVPKYESEAGIAGKELKKTPELSQTDTAKKKLQPKSYKLAKTEYKDDKGNIWNVSIDKTTGEVTATVPGNDKIPETGSKLNVDVEVIYEEEVEVGDKKETKTYTEKTRAQFYSIPSTRQEVKKEYETKLPFETKVIYDENIPAGKVVEEGGKVGKQKMVFSQIIVGNKKGALDENGNFVEGKEAVTTEVVEKAQDKIIRIGTKPAETTVEVPFDTEYELDYTKKKGENQLKLPQVKKVK
ncbi:adhesin domain containing protein [uncultured Peptoniphilus sp.]|uniref:adhesin domain containing protein n=1 Tax=uncultured Peptoniphilus sp. TaxID=254354 RepID=UPI0028049A13|nr:adhesin domain containing protein [uncultured Peptoniphilus sp.]